jgi:hypothetical protein
VNAFWRICFQVFSAATAKGSPRLDPVRDCRTWLDATLSGHQSASAAHEVGTFLQQMTKDYPERLRRNILSSADELFRARRIRHDSR